MSTSLIPDEELQGKKLLNLTPMVDFLFLLVAVFAILAVTRTVLRDSELQPVKMGQDKVATTTPTQFTHSIILSITAEGQYKWISGKSEIFLETGSLGIKQKIAKEQELGHLPLEKEKMRILLQIDKNAPWASIANLIFTMKEEGYAISPLL